MNIIGVDHLDYTKGLPEKFRSFSRLLEFYPQNCRAVALIQIAPPTRGDVQAYVEIRHELEALSGAFVGIGNWTPVSNIHRNVPRHALAALYRSNQVGLVTPLRDGMSLVAKEYVAAQNEQNPGVLVLSSFASAAEDLAEALVVNPYNADEVADARQRAITMRREERVERQRAFVARIRERDARAWMGGFLRALAASRPRRALNELCSAAIRQQSLVPGASNSRRRGLTSTLQSRGARPSPDASAWLG